MDQVANNQPSGAEFAEGGGDASPPTAPTTSPQQPAQSTVDEVAELLSRHAGEPGYGKVVVDYLGSTVRLYWKGTLPADLTRLRNSTVKGVTIEIVDAKYSESDLVAAGQQAAALIEDRFGEGTVAATMPNETMSGIVVEIVRPWSGSVQDIEEQIGLPVTVRLVDEGPVPADE
jgi:hypothetical protein